MTCRSILPSLPYLLLACNPLRTTTLVVPTEAPPAEPPPPTALPEPTTIPGWLTHRDEGIGYAFGYSPEVPAHVAYVDRDPAEEAPVGMENDDYVATREAAHADGICAYVGLPAATFVVAPAEDRGGRYTGPCGVPGIGVYDVRKEKAPITIDVPALVLGTTRLYEVGAETLVSEFSMLWLDDGTRLGMISAWERNGKTYQDYLADRAILLRGMTSDRADP